MVRLCPAESSMVFSIEGIVYCSGLYNNNTSPLLSIPFPKLLSFSLSTIPPLSDDLSTPSTNPTDRRSFPFLLLPHPTSPPPCLPCGSSQQKTQKSSASRSMSAPAGQHWLKPIMLASPTTPGARQTCRLGTVATWQRRTVVRLAAKLSVCWYRTRHQLKVCSVFQCSNVWLYISFHLTTSTLLYTEALNFIDQSPPVRFHYWISCPDGCTNTGTS
jgi:hypothetical protein